MLKNLESSPSNRFSTLCHLQHSPHFPLYSDTSFHSPFPHTVSYAGGLRGEEEFLKDVLNALELPCHEETRRWGKKGELTLCMHCYWATVFVRDACLVRNR
ncbi:unnamed protein product, partial [Ectocarpus sp. 12 AP-2014]